MSDPGEDSDYEDLDVPEDDERDSISKQIIKEQLSIIIVFF